MPVLLLCLAACGGRPEPIVLEEAAPTPRRLVVWLDETGLDAETASRLAGSGVDLLVVRRGSILLSGGAPVVRLHPAPVVEGALPVAVELEVEGLGGASRDGDADAVWTALAADFDDALPAELILDLPDLGDGAAEFVARLTRSSGLAVVPLLSIDQLETELGRQVARAAGRCIVPAFGVHPDELRGLESRATRPLDVRLAPIRDLGIKVRVAAVLRPLTEPPTPGWAADLDPLTDETVAEMSRTSTLDRSFVVRRATTWAGAAFDPGDTIAVGWVDIPRLHLFLAETHRMLLPEIIGWDLISLPPTGSNLGMDRDELIRYLEGAGPGPDVEVRLDRRGRVLTVEMVNGSVFRSAVTGVGNWVQLELASGSLVAEQRGDFDRVILGRLDDGQWRPTPIGRPDAVRFVENYLAPGERVVTGRVRLPASRSRVVVRWQVQLSDGTVLTGVVD
jgi:hypothetical protein